MSGPELLKKNIKKAHRKTPVTKMEANVDRVIKKKGEILIDP